MMNMYYPKYLKLDGLDNWLYRHKILQIFRYGCDHFAKLEVGSFMFERFRVNAYSEAQSEIEKQLQQMSDVVV